MRKIIMTHGYRQERELGIALGIIVAAIGLWPLSGGEVPHWELLLIATVAIVSAIFKPRIFSPALKVWLPLGHLLGKLNNGLLLVVIFFLLITPMALLFRLLHRDALKLQRDACDSGWVIRNEVVTPQSLRNQY